MGLIWVARTIAVFSFNLEMKLERIFSEEVVIKKWIFIGRLSEAVMQRCLQKPSPTGVRTFLHVLGNQCNFSGSVTFPLAHGGFFKEMLLLVEEEEHCGGFLGSLTISPCASSTWSPPAAVCCDSHMDQVRVHS